MSAGALQPVADAFGFLTPRPTKDHVSFNCPPDKLREVVTALRDRFGFDLLMDVTAVDWESEAPRFSTVYHFYSLRLHEYVRLVVPCEDDINPTVPSVADLFPAADWHERETYDMFGILFAGHPDLRRILMWEDYPYFPLRKEFPLAGLETELPDRKVADETGASVLSAPMMGGPFVAKTGTNMSKAEPRAADQSWTERWSKPSGEA